ncbi:cation diffusion facilitator family transporter [Cellulomonas triticagri]|uniref:Cation transporter n=1 Tax=Cellulomonas triticagri TaxID=2483352 RepID=A0A3M2JD44_9CELL|nr:cation diffusion facilitator family transporter [Cellulomonas triticagri]RMI09513.1 cation transporter [Cellulomonas triticagri]
MSHGHDHGDASTPDHRRRLAIAFGLTATVLVAQAVGAVVTGSLALLVDTAHMLTDTGGLAMALVAAHLVRRPATSRRTWGLRRAEVLAALAQSAVLLAVGVYVLVEAVRRFAEPPEVPSRELLVFGVVGLAANLVSLGVLAGGRSASFNLRAAFLEVLNDALGSVGVIVAAVVIGTTGWQQADAVAGVLIGLLIVPRAVRLLRETAAVLLESTPPGLDLDAVREHLLGVEHVRDVHDLHASLVATGLPVVTAHVVVDDACFGDGHAGRILDQLQECLATHFPVSVEHSTFQVEPVAHRGHEHLGHA